MPPKTPMNEVPRRASRVEEDAQELRPRARRRLTTGSAGDSGQEYNTSEALGSGVELEVRANGTPEKAPAAEAPPKYTAAKQYQVDLVPAWVAKRYSQSSIRPPLPSVMAQKYELWKDDLDFVAEQETYWGTVAPRLTDLRLESHQPVQDGEEQEEHRLSCTPCLDQGRECSKEMPICAQCRSEEASVMCSYHVDRAYVPDSKRQGATKKKRRILDANLAVALEYLDGAMDDIENGDLSNDDPSNDGAWKVGVQVERDPHEEADSAVKESAKSDWLAKALFADDEGRGYHGPAKVPRKRGRPWKIPPGEKQPVKIKRSVGRPRKEPTEEGPVKSKRSWKVGMKDEELLDPVRSVNREKMAVKMAILEAERKRKNEDKTRGKGKGKLKDKLKDTAKAVPQRRGFTGRVMERYLKDTTRKLNTLITWTEAHKSPTGDQGQEGSEVVAEAGVKVESDGETATPVLTKYKEQIANTFRPWVAQKDEKVIPSACDPPDTSLLQALHYYTSYYYTHVSPSPDMFEAMDMTSHIALGMIVQEIISDFAFKLGKDSQLEDIQVKVDKLVAAQYGDKWDKNFLDYLESRTGDRSLPLNQPAKKRRHSGSMDRSAESADDGGSDTDMGEDDGMSHDSRTWDELEDLRRTTTSLGVGTVKELVNRTRFDISVEETLEMGLDGKETGRRSRSPLHVDSDLDSTGDSDAGSTSTGNGGWLQSTLTSSKETPFKIALGNDSEISLSGEEDTEMPVRDATRSTTRVSEVALDRGDYDMPEIDFSPSILTQLSNNRFGSQPAFGLDDSLSDGDDGSDELDGPTLVRSQNLQEDSYESPKVEDGSSESDSEQEEKVTGEEKDKEAKDKATGEKDAKKKEGRKEESERDVDSDKGGHMQEDYDDAYGASEDDSISLSVLTQVSATRFGSAFKLSRDESFNEEDDVYNPSGGRFIVQSQVVQDDSDDDSSEVSSDSDSGQEEQDEESEEKDTIAVKDAGDNKPTKEDHLKGHIAAETKENSTPIKNDYAEDDDEVVEVVSEITGASRHEESDAEPIELPKRLSGRAIEEFSVEMETVEVETEAETVDEIGTREQSKAGSEADVDMPSDEKHKTREFLTKKDDRFDEEEEDEDEEHKIRETLMDKDDRSNEKEQEEEEAEVEEDKGDPSQPVYMTVSATRFGSRFSASYNADDGDESEEEGTAYSFGTQSQVVYDDSTTSEEENVQSSSESDSD